MKTILIVDDDSSALEMAVRALKGYQLYFARDAHEGLRAALRLADLDLLVTDYLMPSMTGEELVGRIRERKPELKALFVTGHADILDGENLDWWKAEAHVAKPFSLGQLRQAVADLIGEP